MHAFIGPKRIRLDPHTSLGKGGEADIFEIGGGLAVKIFKAPDHPDLLGDPNEIAAARERLKTHQTKLLALQAFRAALSPRVILPTELAKDDAGMVIGYAMPAVKNAEVLARYAERPFREAGISNDAVGRIFLDLHSTVAGVHQAGIVIGDFNDLNILVKGEDAYLIDTDSFQFGRYLSRMFTVRFVDPTHCDPKAGHLMLVTPHSVETDWYAYAVMLMQSLLFVGPYGGIYRPKDARKRVLHDARPLARITVFHPDMTYPKPAIHYKVLPDDLLQKFHRIFERDERGEFPRSLIEGLRWRKCPACGTVHARSVCPVCALPGIVKQTVRVSGKVVAVEILKTKGMILHAVSDRGNIRWLVHESGKFLRENGAAVLTGELDPLMRVRISGERTLIGKGARLVTISPGAPSEMKTIDTYGSLPLFDATSTSRFWVEGGRLMKDGVLAPEEIGSVLQDQTVFWAGEKFGFGFYRAGTLSVAFVFEPHVRGLNDSVSLPGFTGRLVDSSATFADERVWFFATLEDKGRMVNRAFVIGRTGVLEAVSEGIPGDGSWLSTIRGRAAVGKTIFAATDEGIVRAEVDGSGVVVTRSFPDTEPYVDEESKLLLDGNGIVVVRAGTITHLSLA